MLTFLSNETKQDILLAISDSGLMLGYMLIQHLCWTIRRTLMNLLSG